MRYAMRNRFFGAIIIIRTSLRFFSSLLATVDLFLLNTQNGHSVTFSLLAISSLAIVRLDNLRTRMFVLRFFVYPARKLSLELSQLRSLFVAFCDLHQTVDDR